MWRTPTGGSPSIPGSGLSSLAVSPDRTAVPVAVAVHAAQYSSSLAMRLIHSTTATGTAKAPYMLFPATPCR